MTPISLKLSVVMLTCTFLFVSEARSQRALDEQSLEVSMRMIGHQILLNAKDSTSRVLPISRENGNYRISFESEFDLNPDSLLSSVSEVFSNYDMSEGYILEVQRCQTQEVVYSYQVGNKSVSDIIPCQMRSLPKSCYTVLISLIDVNNDALSSTTNSNTAMQSSLLTWFLLIAVITVIIYLLLLRRTNSTDPNLIRLGDYTFDKLNTKLIYGDKNMELTSKESDLLLLLYNDVNANVEREVILQKVWGDEGDYIGRTVDVFISKLRKKLEFDSKVKIVNIRGVGYKLVLNA